MEHFQWRHAVLQHGRRIVQTDLDIQDSHAHHARMRSPCPWASNGEVHGETIMHNNVIRCLHKWILISVATEAAMLEDSMTSRKNALYNYSHLSVSCVYLISFVNEKELPWIYMEWDEGNNDREVTKVVKCYLEMNLPPRSHPPQRSRTGLRPDRRLLHIAWEDPRWKALPRQLGRPAPPCGPLAPPLSLARLASPHHHRLGRSNSNSFWKWLCWTLLIVDLTLQYI